METSGSQSWQLLEGQTHLIGKYVKEVLLYGNLWGSLDVYISWWDDNSENKMMSKFPLC